MEKISKETLENAYNPFDVVTDEKGNVGYIKQVNMNDCQTMVSEQISYAVAWIVGMPRKEAWFRHDELKRHSNLMVSMYEHLYRGTVHPEDTRELFESFSVKQAPPGYFE